MSIEVGDVFRNEKEHESCLVIDTDNPWDEGVECKVLYLQRDKDSFRYYHLSWTPERLLLGQNYVKIGHIDISILMEEESKQ